MLIKKISKTRVFLIIALAAAVFSILSFALVLYPKINYYEPLHLIFDSKCLPVSKSISMRAVTPFNRTIPMPFDSINQNFPLDYSYLKEIHLILPPSMIKKGISFHLIIGERNYEFDQTKFLKSWVLDNTANGLNDYRLMLPEKQKSFFPSLFSIALWPMMEPLYFPLLIILFISVLGLVVYRMREKIRRTLSAASFIQKAIYLGLFFLSLILLYLGVREINLLRTKGMEHISFFSSILFYFVFFVLLWQLFRLIFKLFKIRSQLRRNLLLSVAALFAAILMSEIGLRIFGINSTYYERTMGSYGLSNYDSRYSSRFHLRPKNKIIRFNTSEFKYFRHTNEMGLCEKTISENKTDSVIRIIALGDSFTEGIGVEEDSTWVRLLEKKMNQSHYKYELINAGVIGSDPFYQFVLLKDRLLKYKPDIVIVATNNTDFSDIIIRGGYERFLPNGQVKFNKGPWWELIYACSYFFRAVLVNGFGYDYHLLGKKEQKLQYKSALNKLNQICLDFYQLSKEKKFELYFVVHPLINEVKQKSYFVLGDLIAVLKENNINFIDLMPYFIKKTETSEPGEYYWLKDQHYKCKGQALFAEAVFEFLQEKSIVHETEKRK